MYKNIYRQNSQLQGFTLVETLVAISILLIVIIGPMTIAARGLQSSYFANDQTTAVFLAQEALESIIKLRDDAALDRLGSGSDPTWEWYSNNGNDIPQHCKNSNQGCGYNPASVADPYFKCNGGGNPCVIKHDSTNSTGYRYQHSVGDDTIFTRSIIVEDQPVPNAFGGSPSDDNPASVTVTVSWESNLFGGDRKVVLQTWLYDHYNRFEN